MEGVGLVSVTHERIRGRRDAHVSNPDIDKIDDECKYSHSPDFIFLLASNVLRVEEHIAYRKDNHSEDKPLIKQC